MTVVEVAAFDVCGPLPEGTTVLEASAGTGKTFTIAALATRYVAEGAAELSELMLVTFSRAATQELRERVRGRLVSAERGLADPAAARADGQDPLLQLLASGDDEEVRHRRRRLSLALAGFDAATIATTHGFCQQMLAGLGMAGDSEPDATFVESVDDLVTEVVGDLYLRKYALAEAVPPIDYPRARQTARVAMQDRQATLAPTDAEDGSAAQQRYRLAGAVRHEVEVRKRDRRLLDYDDLLTRLRDALRDPVRGAAAVARVRRRYRVVLVDEFQDTDPVQWEILLAAFHGATTLVLIGDPKQAIYAFRGADLITYLAAVEAAATRRTLARNWRSDGDLLTALRTVFRGAAMGDPGIVVRPVLAANAGRRLSAPPTAGSAAAPVRLRVTRRDQAEQDRRGLTLVPGTRLLVARDLAADVVGLLAGPVTLQVAGAARPVRPGDVAVLVRTNGQAALVRDRLGEVNVPAVLTGSRSVFLTRPAREWLVLLHALEQPHRGGLVRAAALTGFLGWTAAHLDAGGETGLDELGTRLRQWRDVLADRGVAALVDVVASSGQLSERLLGTPTGERDLTDLRHVGQALHAAAVDGQLGPAALVEWLQRRVTEAAEDAAEDRSRRLESDADAVSVVTVHGSKGLQFPVVYVPFGWDRYVDPSPDPLRLHDADGTRVLDVGGPEGPGYRDRLQRHQEEESGEDLRLLYVAMTRAQCQVVVWWAPARTAPASALTRLLFGSFEPGGRPPRSVPPPADSDVQRLLAATAADSSGTLAVEPVEAGPSARWQPVAGPAVQLTAGVFDRGLDRAWRRTSYTGLTAAVHDGTGGPPVTFGGVGSEPEVPDRADEVALAPAPRSAAVGDDEERLRAVPSPLADLPAGTAFGTLVHGVLEAVDPTAVDLPAELRTRCAAAVGARLGTSIDPDALAAGLVPVLRTPLGPLASGRRLRDIAPADRLVELDFELPLAGGDRPRVIDGTLGAVADLLRRHLARTDPLSGYPDALDVAALRGQRLRGYLTGSIDAVLRLRDEAGEARYVIVDYKTNWLGDVAAAGAEPLTAWHYRPAALADAMVRAHYPLQALLYAVALHRYLRWRQPSYDPDRHLGGVLYLFVRGMSGPSTPVVGGTPCGVFGWRPPAGLVPELSALLDGTAV